MTQDPTNQLRGWALAALQLQAALLRELARRDEGVTARVVDDARAHLERMVVSVTGPAKQDYGKEIEVIFAAAREQMDCVQYGFPEMHPGDLN